MCASEQDIAIWRTLTVAELRLLFAISLPFHGSKRSLAPHEGTAGTNTGQGNKGSNEREKRRTERENEGEADSRPGTSNESQ